MSKAAFSVRVFSYYLFGLGGVLLIVPNSLLALFALPPTQEVWIRVVGMLVALLGYYYYCGSLNDLTEFIRATVHARVAVLIGFVGLVALGFAPAVLILFGAIDAGAACWTAWCLRQEGIQAASD